MSLIQQGSQTAMNKKAKITIQIRTDMPLPKAIRIWNDEAQVLSKTWPACGNFVLGQK
ncbi:unnamed protein product [marine sediment metagenome]|uniref:Uncharacterized protein n=1 Tax=marine sediment metagenome TaxID=412755 RepID=X0W0F2_9ZZZZ